MRITTRIATAGKSGLSRFPVPDIDIDDCKDAEGHLDEDKARRALSIEGVQWSNDDNRAIIAFVLEYLRQLKSVVNKISEDPKNDCRVSAETKGDSSCQRRMRRGSCAFVRVDVWLRGDSLAVRLGWDNPREVVGGTEEFARKYAEMCARILVYIRDEIGKDDSHIPIVLIDGKNCEGFFAQASETNEWFNRRDKALAELEPLRAKRVSCPNRRIDFCSGLHTDCPLYRNGRCMEPELPDDLKE